MSDESFSMNIQDMLTFRMQKPKEAVGTDPVLWQCDACDEVMPMDDVEDHANGKHFKSVYLLTTVQRVPTNG